LESTHLSRHVPTVQAALQALSGVNAAKYARTRNALDGAVTRLSPYITHGLLTVAQCVQALRKHQALSFEDKLVFEFAWREYFHHVWERLGEKILHDIRSPVWPGAYAQQLPDDIRQARTGVPVIDQTVRDLYATGYLHNHARMWLASYVVHLRKVHWRTGADWLYGHLLDGHLASNHLSWQWVAGTFSSKPYLFNAENVAKYAPAAYHSPGTVIDTDYSELDYMARERGDIGCKPSSKISFLGPELLVFPTEFVGSCASSVLEKMTHSPVRLVHPWMLGEAPLNATLNIGLIHIPFHSQFPWSADRWAWVLARMQALCPLVFVGDGNELISACRTTSQISSSATLNPHYAQLLPTLCRQLAPAPRLLPNPARLCNSFSRFYDNVRRSVGSLDDLMP
jgi:deoxyribodipyrimidine photo-lyase